MFRPLPRFRDELREAGILDEETEATMTAEARRVVEQPRSCVYIGWIRDSTDVGHDARFFQVVYVNSWTIRHPRYSASSTSMILRKAASLIRL